MFNSAYGAGWRAGMAKPKYRPLPGGLKCIEIPVCPFSHWRFVSNALWHEGYYAGMKESLNRNLKG